MAQRAEQRKELAGSARLVMVQGAALLRPGQAVFEAMLAGWRCQQRSRLLAELTVTWRERIVRGFTAFAGELPWRWAPGDVGERASGLLPGDGHSHATIRSCQRALACFLGYLTDGRCGWAAGCEARFGTYPVQVCHEWNTAAHAADYEGRPERRPFTRAELRAFFDFAGERVAAVRERGRKGWLAAFRDATLFKVTYARGLRRREAAMLDVADFSANPAAPEPGRFGTLAVRCGKAIRSGPPRRRRVATVMPWAAGAVGGYLAEVRPRYGMPGRPALWLTGRGGRISVRQVDERFAGYRDAAGLPGFVTPRCLRHSHVSHLIEDGADPVFVQHQVGHSRASATAGYTSAGADHANRMLRAALDRAFTGAAEGTDR
jgi:integrase/recombinase XerC